MLPRFVRWQLMLHSVAWLDKIRFDPFPDQFGINIKSVHHRGATIQDLGRGSVGEKESEVAGQNLMNLPQPGTAVVLRHEIQFDEEELCFRERFPGPGQDG